MGATVQDEHDNDTNDLFAVKEGAKRLKRAKGGFQRLHIKKITSAGRKATTVSIDDYSYIFLSDRLKQKPFTREANKAIKEWINHKMKNDPTYDSYASYSFSPWLKKVILFEIVDSQLKKHYFDEYANP